MRITAPFDALVPALTESMLEADPLDQTAGNVKEGESYDVPDDIGASLVAQGWKQTGASTSKPRVAKGNSNP